MEELKERPKEAKDCLFRMIVTDGVFSMDWVIANLKDICDLANKYNALVMVDDSQCRRLHRDRTDRGTPEYCNIMGRVDIITGTSGKALGGASGGVHHQQKRNNRNAKTAFKTVFVLQYI